jgi:hypothetical protein
MLACSAAHADPIAVRAREAPGYGVLALRGVDGKTLAHGELVQTVNGDRVESRLSFRFRDGSRSDEKTSFTQAKVFVLKSYQVNQRGPSFPSPLEVTFDASSGRYTVRTQEDGSASAKTLEGKVDFPSDVYNGMLSLLIRNLPSAEGARVHMMAFTPKPRLVKVELVPAEEDTFYVGGARRRARQYRANLELPGLLGIAAAVVGKDPPDLRYWFTMGPVPSFLRFEGPFYVNGPIWRIEMDAPRWSP